MGSLGGLAGLGHLSAFEQERSRFRDESRGEASGEIGSCWGKKEAGVSVRRTEQ